MVENSNAATFATIRRQFDHSCGAVMWRFTARSSPDGGYTLHCIRAKTGRHDDGFQPSGTVPASKTPTTGAHCPFRHGDLASGFVALLEVRGSVAALDQGACSVWPDVDRALRDAGQSLQLTNRRVKIALRRSWSCTLC